jgi:hypothetical protein
LLFGAPLDAQDAKPKPDAKPTKEQDEARKKAIATFAKVQRENRKALLGYRWNQREQVWVDRERRANRTFAMGFDVSGRLQATLLSHSDIKSKKNRDLMRSAAARQKKAKELRAWVEEAESILHQYVYHSPAKMVEFLERAEIKQGEGAYAEAVAAFGASFARPGDHVRVWVNPTTMHPVRIEYTSRVGADAVNGWITYGTLEEGKRYYAARSELRAPAKKIRLTLQNFNPKPPPKEEKK